MSVKIKQITAEETYNLRHQVLRPNQSIKECQYPNDFSNSSFHIGAIKDSNLVSIASFYKELVPGTNHSEAFRLRGMATLENQRGQGIASQLLKFGLQHIRQQGPYLVWCNARTTASGFYEKLGFSRSSEVFEIEGIGPHYLMTIQL